LNFDTSTPGCHVHIGPQDASGFGLQEGFDADGTRQVQAGWPIRGERWRMTCGLGGRNTTRNRTFVMPPLMAPTLHSMRIGADSTHAMG